jgi:predicted dehydrogenase
MRDLGVGIVGCGVISGIYLKNMPLFKGVRLAACTDIIPERSREKARLHNIEAVPPEAMMQRDDVDIILNITPPKVHYEVSLAALEAGKHVFSEKPLCIESSHAARLLKEADDRGLKVGCAPDTFLGAGGRLAREIIDSGRIGKVVAGTCMMMGHGMEHWHPEPTAFYQYGGGPMFDVGPYYLNALINLLGPVASVQARASTAFQKRHVTAAGPLKGQDVSVETPTTLMGQLHFASGADINIVMSWDVWKHGHPAVELYGTEGSMRVPDPNFFGGYLEVTDRGGEWQRISTADKPFGKPNFRAPAWPATRPDEANYRCLGIAELASSVLHGTPHRASVGLGLHAVEVMQATLNSGQGGGEIAIASQIDRPSSFSDAEALALWAGH